MRFSPILKEIITPQMVLTPYAVIRQVIIILQAEMTLFVRILPEIEIVPMEMMPSILIVQEEIIQLLEHLHFTQIPRDQTIRQ